ncbi:hypothetical protein EUGRSUZ_J00375 [Eucalyptus grandis]|uniref:Uncharacterized protein n=2 Tax=Eucalyptus grandis TaxID=71139 RepID=A0ACC3J1L5_EUCGR|nr:hypothetical protein EUGRSUZ_J00375 [Eucalyptus grandis]
MASTFLSPYCFLFSLLVLFSTASPSRISSLIANLSPKTQAFSDSSSLASDGKRLELPLLGNSEACIQDPVDLAFGYYPLLHSLHAKMFFYFVKSPKNVSDPVVLWVAGGPGCSGAGSLFNGNGPYYISDDMTLCSNKYGWEKVSNIIFVDQPTGTGFSFSTDEHDIRQDLHDVSNDLYDFLQRFFTEYDQLARNDFYIAGESYAGHYIPALATRVQQGNRFKEGIHINLKGFAIGNGLTNSGIQYGAYTEYALRKNLIKRNDKIRIDAMFPECTKLVRQCESGGDWSCVLAYHECERIYKELKKIVGNRYEFDIRKECGSNCSDGFSRVETFLNKKEVKYALGVGDIEFKMFREGVFNAMHGDIMKNLAVGIPALLEDGLKVLIYAGAEDLRCNYIGIFEWVEDMEWYGRADFKKSGIAPFAVDGSVAGWLKTHGPLTFLTVNEAGHYVPMDQPKVALQMIQSWMAADVPMAGADVGRATY